MILARQVLLIAAFVCFVLAVLEVRTPRVNLQAAGLALWLVADQVKS